MPLPVVLIADDEQVIRNLLRATLGKEYEIIIAENGLVALELCRARTAPIDLAILDIVMPGMNGPELLACLRELYPRVRAIFMSGYPEETAMHMAGFPMDAGRFLKKPFTLSEVRQVVRAEINAARAERDSPGPKASSA